MSDSISDTITVDTARLPLLLRELRLPTIAAMRQTFTERADREAWPAARLLATLTELGTRRALPATHPATPDRGAPATRQDLGQLRLRRRAHGQSCARRGAGHRRWMDRQGGGAILLFGPSGSGKSHLSAAFGHALIENGYRVLFTRTTDLVQRLQQARQALSLESAIEKLDKYHLLILEDLCYVRHDQAETSVLFELIAARYERRSLMITANQPFGEWTSVFPDAARRCGPPHPPLDNLRDERRKLSPKGRCRSYDTQAQSPSDSKRDSDGQQHNTPPAPPTTGDVPPVGVIIARRAHQAHDAAHARRPVRPHAPRRRQAARSRSTPLHEAKQPTALLLAGLSRPRWWRPPPSWPSPAAAPTTTSTRAKFADSRGRSPPIRCVSC